MRRQTSKMGDLAGAVTDRKTPQNEAIPGREAEMAENNAGGVVFTLDPWTRLRRFLVLGTEGGTYYAGQRKHTIQSVDGVRAAIAEDGPRAVREIVAISDGGRAPKNTPALLALALCCKADDIDTRREAYAALPKVARIGTHLFEWAEAMKVLGGLSSSGAHRAIARWYQNMPPQRLALQAVKYQQRDGWSHRDILRIAKIGAKGKRAKDRHPDTDAILDWITAGKVPVGPESGIAPASSPQALVWAMNETKRIAEDKVNNSSIAKMVNLIGDHRLPRECIPTEFLNSPGVWAALLDNGGHGMPITALIRNLAKMTSVGLIKPLSPGIARVVSLLGDVERLKKGRVHPLQLLVALNTYNTGHGVKGKLTWEPVQQIADALDGAFYNAFQTIEPTGLRWLLGLDISGSMGGGWSGTIAGLPGITPRVGSAAMAMVTARTETQHHFFGFGHQFVPLKISPKQRLDDVCDYLSAREFGSTDCSLPMQYAMKNNLEVDVFAVYTDNETWSGDIHPIQALQQYRQKTGIAARLVVVGMTATEFSIADPQDPGMMDVVGFDTAAPKLMADWSMGRV